MKHLVFAVMILGLVLPLTGCGKKAHPEAPQGSTYPHVYPAPNPNSPAPKTPPPSPADQ